MSRHKYNLKKINKSLRRERSITLRTEVARNSFHLNTEHCNIHYKPNWTRGTWFKERFSRKIQGRKEKIKHPKTVKKKKEIKIVKYDSSNFSLQCITSWMDAMDVKDTTFKNNYRPYQKQITSPIFTELFRFSKCRLLVQIHIYLFGLHSSKWKHT